MPARVHAFIVARVDGHLPVDLHLRRTLLALEAQSRPVDALTVILCGEDEAVTAVVAEAATGRVITAPRRTTFAEALRLATPHVESDAVWLLAQDTAPEPDALAQLAAVLDTSHTVAVAAPKLVRWEARSRIVSFGVSMTRFGRTVVTAEGELDQGQHDGRDDVLGADVRGLLVRAEVWRALDGVDPALAGGDEGLDLGVRARLAGHRVSLAPEARIAVAGDGVAAPRAGDAAGTVVGRSFAQRTAQLHRRLAYAPVVAAPLHWLSLLPLALWRAAMDLVAKRPVRIVPDAAASAVVAVRLGALVRSRARIRRTRTTSWSQLAPLRVTRRQLAQRLGDDPPAIAGGRDELHFFVGGGAWVVLAFLVVSLVAFPALLAWPVLGGGALAPLRATVAGLWADAAYGNRPLGWASVGPADPFAAVVAVIGSLSPWEPSRALVVLWLLALPAAALGGWFAATRLTAHAGLRAVAAIGWALSPAFLAALVEGRPTGVIAHLTLPWLLYAGVIAHRSWSAAGVASLLVVIVVACAPSVAPAVIVLWLCAIVLTVMRRRGDGIARVIWLIVPGLIMWLPMIHHRLSGGDPWSLLADPGVPVPADVPADIVERLLRAAGFATPDPGGWNAFVGGDAAWVGLLVLPLFALAALAAWAKRLVVTAILLLIAVIGIVSALAGTGVVVSAVGAQAVGLWPGVALSLAWAGVLGAALVALEWMPTSARTGAGLLAVVAVAIIAVPSLTALTRGASELRNGPASTLPAYVAAEGTGGRSEGTVVLTPQPDGSLSTVIVWGGTATLGGQTTLVSASAVASQADRQVARVTADLVTDAAGDVVAQLADHGIGFVLLSTSDDETDAARATRRSAQTAMDQRDRLDHVGDAGSGTLWRVGDEVAVRAVSDTARDTARAVAALQLTVAFIALLLAVPTAESSAASRRTPRVVGRRGTVRR